MEAIIAALINVGFGGIVVGALVWFLRQLVSVTIPALTKTYADTLTKAEKRHERVLKAIASRIGRKLDALSERHQDDFANVASVLGHNEAGLEHLLVKGCARGPFPPDLERPPPSPATHPVQPPTLPV